ncbi:galactitol-1-phosphate 5-dehydrogenase [Lachnospiraceae bacterium OttesenSCG-928-D06]|nr:galactitol-1-phosphate 5-dehydrogenase [Lachnospiraceae bacterium OttesenSCG-928-D06]
MKACVLEDIGKLVYKDIDMPMPQEGEVLLRIRACGICSSDIDRVYKTGTYHFPMVPGHEFSGEIVQVGKGVSTDYINKRAVVFPLLPCKKCFSCAEEKYARCNDYNYFGSRCNGGFEEYLTVPLWNILLFSDEIEYSIAALCEPMAVALHGIKTANVEKLSNVLIIGTGMIGFSTAIWAKEFGAKNIIIAGRNKEKLDFAEKLDGIKVINLEEENSEILLEKLTDNEGIDIAFECVGNESSISQAVNYVKKGGQVILIGNPSGNIIFPKSIYWKILRNEISLKGVWNSSFGSIENDWVDTMKYIEKNASKLSVLITHCFALEKYENAFDVVKDKNKFNVKVMLKL